MWMSIPFPLCNKIASIAGSVIDGRMGAPHLGGMTLPFKITVCGLAELNLHRGAKVSHVLSILDPEYPAPEVFGTYGEHAKLELRFDDIIEEAPGLLRAPAIPCGAVAGIRPHAGG